MFFKNVRGGRLSPFQLSRMRPGVNGGAAYHWPLPPDLSQDITHLPALDALKPNVQRDESRPVIDPRKYGYFNNITLNIGNASALVLQQPPSTRIYLMLVNKSVVDTMFIAFGTAANVDVGIPILPNFGYIEFNDVIPQDDVYMISTGAATLGAAIYCNSEK